MSAIGPRVVDPASQEWDNWLPRMNGALASYPRSKLAVASLVATTPLTRLVTRLERAWPFTRVLVYHGTPPRLRDALARQLDYLLERYDGVDARELERVLRRGPDRRSAVVFTFDDGLATNHDVAAPLLEQRNLRGIFCVPADFPSVPQPQQPRWFIEHIRRAPNCEHETAEDMLAMTWDQVRDLASRGHRICCHSRSHHRITSAAALETLESEIIGAKNLLREHLGSVDVDGFCWPVAPDRFARRAHEMMRANYQYVLTGGARPLFAGHDPHAIYRTNLEASWPREVVDLQLSGVIDAIFAARALRQLVVGSRSYSDVR